MNVTRPGHLHHKSLFQSQKYQFMCCNEGLKVPYRGLARHTDTQQHTMKWAHVKNMLPLFFSPGTTSYARQHMNNIPHAFCFSKCCSISILEPKPLLSVSLLCHIPRPLLLNIKTDFKWAEWESWYTYFIFQVSSLLPQPGAITT